MSSNERWRGGILHVRRFAYLEKGGERFGLLEATDYANARKHLGSRFHIKQTWLTEEENIHIGFDRERRWAIVYSIFLNSSSSAFVGK